jgi:molybdopterin converting factor small subunit
LVTAKSDDRLLRYRLVALSVLIVVLASYTALDLAGRTTAARGRVRVTWLAGGATAMGVGSRVQIEHSPKTLAEALSALWTIYPGVRDRIATEQGQVREHVNIFIGDESVRYTGGLASPVPAECEISIVPAVSGG